MSKFELLKLIDDGQLSFAPESQSQSHIQLFQNLVEELFELELQGYFIIHTQHESSRFEGYDLVVIQEGLSDYGKEWLQNSEKTQ